jgi:ABC-type uncharacterized transport system involved in gliding motility auxiliary subunit
VGLLFAVFGLIFLGFGVVALLVGAHGGWIYGHFVFGVAFLGYAAATSLREFREILLRDATKRGARYGGNVAVQTLIVTAILGFVAYLSVQHPVRWDWTEAGIHGLAEGTKETLAQIPEEQPVEILAFYQAGSEGAARDALERYTYQSDRVRFRMIDPNREPNLATRHEIRTNGVLIVCGGECSTATGTARVTEPTEEALTRAIRSVISQRKILYFLTGHGEASPDDTEVRGLSLARDALAAENLEIRTLLLAREAGVPDDAAAVVVAGPERPFQPRELEALDSYVRGGGAVLVMIDPFVDTNLLEQVAAWGVEVGNDVIVDQQIQLFAGPQVGVQPIVVSYGAHPITRKLGANPTLFHVARSLRATDGAEIIELASTGASSWAETDTQLFLEQSMVGKDAPDRAGPIALAVARIFEGEGDGEGRLVVVGDSDFGRNRYFAEFYNQDFLINAVNWLAGEESFITIERKLPRASLVTMSPDEFTNFRYLSLFVLPEAILLWGIVLWWRRRT